MKTLISGLMLLCSFTSLAQHTYYKDSVYQMPYTTLINPVSVNNGISWDDDVFTVPIGFGFWFFNDSINSLWLMGNIPTVTPNPDNADTITGMFPIGSDLQDRDTSGTGSQSPISYQLSGTAPNRIFKLEWRNAGFYNAIANNNYNDSISLQMWLYENGDIVEMHYGPGNYVSPSVDLFDGGPGAWVGIFDSLDILVSAQCRMEYHLSGPTANPVLDSLTNFGFPVPPGMNGMPASGTVYRFTPKTQPQIPNSLVEKEPAHLKLYYASDQDQLVWQSPLHSTIEYRVMDIQGRCIRKGSSSQHHIDLSELPRGMYVAEIRIGGQALRCKFTR